MKQKNHSFLLNVFSKLHEIDSRYKLLLIGQGELENELRVKIESCHLGNAVIFGGIWKDIPEIMSAMDIFVFPSLYEGMPNTVIEAQAMGLPCYISDTITREANITNTVSYLSIKDSDHWVNSILQNSCIDRKNNEEIFMRMKYDIQSQAEEFVRLIYGYEETNV